MRHAVCFFNSHRAWGGGEKWHGTMAVKLQAQGFPVLVISNSQSELFQRLRNANSVAVQALPITNLSFLNPWKILAVSRLLRAHRIRTLIVNLPTDLKVAGIAAKIAGVPRIVYRRGIALPVRNTRLNRWLFQHVVTGLVINSQTTRSLILQHAPNLIATDRIHLLYSGVDLETPCHDTSEPLYVRQGDEIVIGNAGRLSEEKGQRYLLELARILKNQGLHFKILIAGTGTLAEQLAQQARQLGVEQDVLFLGFVQDMPRFLRSIDLFVLPSLFEGGANVLLEAMAARKPAIAFHLSSNPEFIEQNQTGFLVKKGDINGLAECVSLLARDASLRETFGLRARARVEQRFSLQRAVDELAALIEQ